MTYRSSSPRAITSSAAIALLLAGAALPGAQAQGQGLGKDAPGSQDHPLVQRFTGSALIGYAKAEWETAQLPTSPQLTNNQRFKDLQAVEGKVTRLVYLSPQGKSPLEVYRNYEQAPSAAGLKRKLSCEKDCYELYQAMGLSMNPTQGLTWTDKFYETKTGSFQSYNALYYREARVLSGTLQRGGVETHVTMLTTKAGNDASDYAATYLQIIEPKAMQTGQVTVDAKALQSGLLTDGKIALYGLFFDTGKAEIKPEVQGPAGRDGQAAAGQCPAEGAYRGPHGQCGQPGREPEPLPGPCPGRGGRPEQAALRHCHHPPERARCGQPGPGGQQCRRSRPGTQPPRGARPAVAVQGETGRTLRSRRSRPALLLNPGCARP